MGQQWVATLFQDHRKDKTEASPFPHKRIRKLMVELAWLWLRYQPHSALSQWFEQRFGNGGKRMRRIGIVAVARKLLIALWRYLEHGVLPEGAVLKAV